MDAARLMQQASLWFLLEHIAVGSVHPQLPKTVVVGDIMAGRPGKTLPPELEKFMSETARVRLGFILVSLRYNILTDFSVTFCEAFSELKRYFGVIWRTEELEICSGGEHVMRMPWIPQNDLLADPRVVMFISDGGINSIVESVYHAKPLIIFPNTSDQWLNVAAAESKGFAVKIPFPIESKTIVQTIENVYEDPLYKRNALMSSALLHDQRDTPAQRVSAMIDHVIKYGDRHLQTEVTELSNMTMLDIFAILSAIPSDMRLSVLFYMLSVYVVFFSCMCLGCVAAAVALREKLKTE